MKKKILTFSYDDGVVQDRRLIGLLDRYGLKAAFNLNSGCFGQQMMLDFDRPPFLHQRIREEEARELYRNHEVAAHTLTHPDLKSLSDEEIIRQTEEDRRALEALTGKSVIGFAYPGGKPVYTPHVAEVLRRGTGLKFARTVDDTHGFDLPADFLTWHPTCFHLSPEIDGLADRFLAEERDETMLFYIWGHAYELDWHDKWEQIEVLFAKLAGHPEIEYATPCEIYLAVQRGEITR